MSVFLPSLNNGWEVDQAIVTEEERVVVIRFGHCDDPECMLMDETLHKVMDKVSQFAVIYTVDQKTVPDFDAFYELTDNITLMFFFRNRHMMIDLGTGDNNKVTWPITSKQDVIDLIETVYRGATKGRGLVTSPKDFSTRLAY